MSKYVHRSRPLSITGICSGVPIPGEMSLTAGRGRRVPFPKGYEAPTPDPTVLAKIAHPGRNRKRVLPEVDLPRMGLAA
jgi:hypothetical protein